MPHNKAFTRREALKAAALGALALPLAGVTSRAASSAAPARPRPRFNLGLASFTFAKLSPEEFIPVLRRLELSTVSLYKTHAPWPDGTPAKCRAAVQKFADAGIRVTSTGMIEITNDEASVRRAFENVRAAGLKMCSAHQKADALPLLDKLVKEYDLKVAIHNHGPTEDFPTGLSVWNAIQHLDLRIGLCLDIAHGFRAGEDPAATVRLASKRLYQLHLRDTSAPGGAMKDPNPTVIGHGAIDIRGVLAALLAVGYVRGLLTALTA